MAALAVTFGRCLQSAGGHDWHGHGRRPAPDGPRGAMIEKRVCCGCQTVETRTTRCTQCLGEGWTAEPWE